MIASKLTKGFSLLELLVVILIISIIISVALLAFGNFGKGRQIRNSVEQFANTLTLVEEQAILEPKLYALMINQEGYGFYDVTKQNGKFKWMKITKDKLLRFHPWPSDTRIKLHISQQTPFSSAGPQIIITPSGTLTSFVLQIRTKQTQYEIKSLGNGAVLTKFN